MYGGRVKWNEGAGRKREGVADEGKDQDKGMEWQTDEKISEGGEKGLGEGQIKAINWSGGWDGACFYIFTASVLSGYLWIHEELTSVWAAGPGK